MRIRTHEGSSNIVTNKFPNDPPDAGWKVSYTLEDGKIKVDNWQGQKQYDFVITQDGELIIGSKHSYLADNKNVLAAGQLKIDNGGNLRNIINSSGHYQPTPAETLNFPEVFRDAGVKTKNAWLEGYEWIPDSSGTVVDFHKVYSVKIGE